MAGRNAKWYSNCYELNICVLPKFLCWSPTPQCHGTWRRGPLGGDLGLGELTKAEPCWAQSPYKKGHQRACTLSPFAMWGLRRDRGLSPEPDHAGTGSWTSRTVRNKSLLFVPLGSMLWQPEQRQGQHRHSTDLSSEGFESRICY